MRCSKGAEIRHLDFSFLQLTVASDLTPERRGESHGVVNAQNITGVARIIAGVETYTNVPYRIGIAETNGRRSMTGGTIEVTPAVISSLHDMGECAIELGNVLGWFRFIVTDVQHREIKLTGWLNVGGFAGTETRP